MSDQDRSNVYRRGAYSADKMFNEIADLRERIIEAWQERGVMLTPDEQQRLLQEIKLTCELLGGLAR